MEFILKEEIEPYLCLNMIVKNESHIIRDTLEKLLKKIKFDYWVISDTGSTDNTKEIILDFFKEVNICGEIFDDEWKGFGHNRTKALEHAFKKSKYLLVFDADDELCGDFVLPELVFDSYHFQFGDATGISYTRTQLINNQKKWKYFGVLHEFIGCMEPTNGTDVIRGNYYTLSGKSGDRSKDSNKYLKDAKILEEAYDEAVNNNDAIYNRYGFYCANSYYDCGKYEDAIKWYKKTLESGCWCQEKYVSCLRIYNCYKCLKQQETGFFYLVKSAEYDKERVECFYELIQHYCCSGLNENAYAYYSVIKPFYDKYLTNGLENKLFIDCSKANFFLPYYMIIVAHNVKDYDTGVYMFRIIFTKKHKEFNKFFVGNILFNLQFFTEKIKSEDLDDFKTLFKGYIDFLLANNYPLYDHDFMNNYEKFGIIVPKFEPEFSREECSKSKKILIYTGYAPFEWNYSFSLENALGGSETSASCLSKSFPNDYEIYVSGGVKEEKVDNVTYVNLHNLKDLIKTNAFHTIIVSRYLHFYEVYKNFSAYQTFIWGHDIELYSYGADISVNNILSKWSSKITGCVCQTEWHKNRFLSLYPELADKMNVINNGIQVELFTSNNKKESNKFIYTSCSERGLSKLIQLWPSILENLPDAELTISSYNKFPNTEEDYKNLEYITQTHSIKHVGKLNRSELYKLMSNAEYWLYPSYFPETSCITSLEMLASQVICLYYPVAGLVNTVGDYGIPIAEGNEIDTLLNLSMKRKCELKKRGKEYGMSCSWQNRASEWCNIIFSKELQLHNNIKQLSAVEKRMFYLYETISMPDAHVKLLSTLSKDFTPNVIYDIGAHALHWTKEASKIWKNAEIIAFDAIKEAEELYKSQNIKYNIGVLSDGDDKIVKFYENKENPAGNSYYKEIGHHNSATIFPEDSYTEQVSMTLGTIVKKNNYILPDLVKIDVQGAELDILKGGINVINHAKYLIIELQHLEYNRGAPLSRVTIDFLNNNGWEIVEEKFSNNGPDADYLFINNNMKRNRELAIFNSFPFHYEMFGYILNYAKKNNYHVDIYTNFSNNLGWFDFYNGLFKGIISFIDYNKFDCEKSNNNYYEFIFITTDDEPLFKKEWIKDNVISINHYYQIRNPNYKYYLNVANFKDSILEYVYACYPLVDFTEKNKNNIITIIGNGKVAEWDYNTINRICSKNEINLNLITRDPELFDASQIDSKIKINIFGNMNAADMIDILKNTSYILSNYNKNYYHNTGLGSSGSSAIALSSLCKLIIGKSSNSFFKLKNVLEFDIDSDEPINIDGDINFKEIQDERTSYVEKFEKYIKTVKYSKRNETENNDEIYLRIFAKNGVSSNLEEFFSTDNLENMYIKKIRITNEDNYTHAIIINNYMPTLNIPKENVIGLAHEPVDLLFIDDVDKINFIEYAKKNISKFFIGDKNDLPEPFIEGNGFVLHNKSQFHDVKKIKFCSIVISSKLFMPGHKYRHKLVDAILNTNLPIDIYGRGVSLYKDYNDCRIKFPLADTIHNPFGTIPFEEYKFNICIENTVSNNYFTEKIINPLLSNVTPIYYGCKKISEYFDNVIELSGEIEKDIKLLEYIFLNQEKYNNNFYTDQILNKCNLFYNLHSLFDNITLKNKTQIKIYVIHYKKLTERKEYLLKQFEREKITNYEFITIDRDQLTESDLSPFQDNFSKPLIANLLSHMHAYKQISKNSYEYNLILEDDVILCDNFSNIIHSYIKQIPLDYDAVFIGDGCDIAEHHVNPSLIRRNCNIYKYHGENKCKCTDSYMISSKCADKLINYFYSFGNKINEPIDYFLNNPLKTSNVYWAEPTLVKQGTIIGLFHSSVGNGMLNYCNGFNPLILTCYKSPFNKVRIGKDFDGGYVVCDIPNIKYEVLLSCGISDDISFEDDFCKKYTSTPCYAYDGTIENIMFDNTSITYIKKNINNFNDDNNTDLHSLIDSYNNIFLKMDIEGYEIPWIKTLDDHQLQRFSQIVIEFHSPFNNTEVEVFNKLNKYFLIIHFHGNNSCGVRMHNGVVIPNVFECTYLNRKYFNNYYELNDENIPIDMENKNVIENTEIYTGYAPNCDIIKTKTYSQASQDIFITNVLQHKKDGYFVEIGTNDPIIGNNSYLLERDYNFKGLLVEYERSYENSYKEHRSNSIYVIDDARKVDYKKILDDNNFPKNVDYLQIDLDADNKSTLDTLLLLNKTVFDTYKFATITFEHDFYRGDFFNTREISREIFKNRGYLLVFPDVSTDQGCVGAGWQPFEDWYVHPDLVDMYFVNLLANKETRNDYIKSNIISRYNDYSKYKNINDTTRLKVVFNNNFNVGDIYFSQPFIKNIITNNPEHDYYIYHQTTSYYFTQFLNIKDVNTMPEFKEELFKIFDFKIDLELTNIQKYLSGYTYRYDATNNILLICTWLGLLRSRYPSMIECDMISYNETYQTFINDINKDIPIHLKYNSEISLDVYPSVPTLDINKYRMFKQNITDKKIIFYYNFMPSSGQPFPVKNIEEHNVIISTLAVHNIVVITNKNAFIGDNENVYFADDFVEDVEYYNAKNFYYHAQMANESDYAIYFDFGRSFMSMNKTFIEENNKNVRLHITNNEYYYNVLNGNKLVPDDYLTLVKVDNCRDIISKLDTIITGNSKNHNDTNNILADYKYIQSLKEAPNKICFEWNTNYLDMTLNSLNSLYKLGIRHFYLKNMGNVSTKPPDAYNDINLVKNELMCYAVGNYNGIVWCEYRYIVFHGEIHENKNVDQVIRSYFPDYNYKGVFFDIGAYDPIIISNSYHFEKNGWECYCFEANPNLIPLLKEHRKNVFNYAISNENKDSVTFQICMQNQKTASFSAITISEKYKQIFSYSPEEIIEITVPQKTIDSIIDNEIPNVDKIDIVSLDIEGGELDCLYGFNLNKYKPRLIVIENATNDDLIKYHLYKFGYKLDKHISYNQYYTLE